MGQSVGADAVWAGNSVRRRADPAGVVPPAVGAGTGAGAGAAAARDGPDTDSGDGASDAGAMVVASSIAAGVGAWPPSQHASVPVT